MKKIKSLLLAATVLVGAGMFATSCGEKDTKDTLSVTPETLSFSAVDTKEQMCFVVTNVTDWNQVPSADWVVTEKTGKSLKVTVKNNTGKEERTATIAFSAGSAASVTVTVKQAGEGNQVENPTYEQYLGEYTAAGEGMFLKETQGKPIQWNTKMVKAAVTIGGVKEDVYIIEDYLGEKDFPFALSYRNGVPGILLNIHTNVTGEVPGENGGTVKLYSTQKAVYIYPKDGKLMLGFIEGKNNIDAKWIAVSNTLDFAQTYTDKEGNVGVVGVGVAAMYENGEFANLWFMDALDKFTLTRTTPMASDQWAASSEVMVIGEYNNILNERTPKFSGVYELDSNSMKLVRAK